MRTTVVALLGLIGGFLAGIVLFERSPEIELSIFILAAACAIVATVVDRWLRSGST